MIHLTREVRFSVDRDWAGHVDPARPVTNAWGGWPSAVGLVPYLRLRVTVVGEPDPQTGYLVNIRQLDELVRTRAIPLVAERLAERGWHFSAVAMLSELWPGLRAHVPAPALLTRLELLATPTLSFTLTQEDPTMVLLTQQFEFSAAHRLHAPTMSAAENREYFGKCNNPSGHGHNYVVEVTIAGTAAVADGTAGGADPTAGAGSGRAGVGGGPPGAGVASAAGTLLPLPRFEALVQQHVIDRLDHKHLNTDTTEFRETNPTVENIARVIWGLLEGRLTPATLHNVRVYETPKTWAEYRGS